MIENSIIALILVCTSTFMARHIYQVSRKDKSPGMGCKGGCNCPSAPRQTGEVPLPMH